MTKQNIWLSLGIAASILLVAVLSWLMLRDPNTPAVSITPIKSPSSQSSSGGAIPLELSRSGGSIPIGGDKNDNPSNPQSNGLQVLGSSSESSGSSTSNRLPLPAEFDQYEVYANETSALFSDVIEGNGREASVGDTLAVVYSGWLTNGKLFDKSKTNSQGQIEPFVFKLGVGSVIKGWEQGLLGMREGGKRRLVIPSSVGYGPEGRDPIPPSSMLVFDVELIQVQEPFNPDAGL